MVIAMARALVTLLLQLSLHLQTNQNTGLGHKKVAFGDILHNPKPEGTSDGSLNFQYFGGPGAPEFCKARNSTRVQS